MRVVLLLAVLLVQSAGAFSGTRRFLFPHNPLDPKQADEPYQNEFLELKKAGAECSLFDFDELSYEFKPKPKLNADEVVLYRGWMMSPKDYAGLVDKIEAKGCKALTSATNYTKCHHLPGWYESCKRYTPETVFFPYDDSLRDNISKLEWDRYFVKDYVKSNTVQRGSIAKSVEEAMQIIELIKEYRGEIEGGVAVRRVEEFEPNTEQRYFVMEGNVYGPDGGAIPELVQAVAATMEAPFYSVDTIMRSDGVLRLVEIGDGQVSDRKNWEVDRFVSMLLS